jgi:hypothetical protein
VALDVEDELLAADRLTGDLRLDRGLGRDRVAAARLAGPPERVDPVRLARASVQGEQCGGRAADRQEELATGQAQARRVIVARQACPPDRLDQDGRQGRFRVVLRVRGGPERDR